MRYSLRTLLIAITMLGIWMGVEVRGARRQAFAVSEIKKLGGWVLYDFEFDPQVGSSRNLNGRSWVPRWVSARTGLDWFHTVVAVNMVYDIQPGGGRTDNRQEIDAAMRDTPPYRRDFKDILAGVPHLRQLFCIVLKARMMVWSR